MKKLFTITVCLLALASTAQAQKLVQGIKHQSYITIGTTPIEGGMWGGEITGVFGVRLSDTYYIGIETGFNFMDTRTFQDRTYDYGYVPVALNTRYMFPVGPKFLPFINVSVGAAIGVMDQPNTAFYMQLGAGFDYKRLTFGLGYMGLDWNKMASGGYFKIGIKFGGKTW